jgi:hypothetical protein
MPDLSDYTHLMLGTQNQTRPEAVEFEADPVIRTKQGKERARGVPIIGPGSLGGVIEGTDPIAALLAKAERMGW